MSFQSYSVAFTFKALALISFPNANKKTDKSMIANVYNYFHFRFICQHQRCNLDFSKFPEPRIKDKNFWISCCCLRNGMGKVGMRV